MTLKVRREVRTNHGMVLPKAEVTREQQEQLDRGAASAFGTGGGCFCFDEPSDPIEAASSTTRAEWQEQQVLADRMEENQHDDGENE